MAGNEDREQDQKQAAGEDGGGSEGKREEQADADAPKDPSFRAYLKLFATILVSLLLFAGLMRGCAACQDKNPITGEPTEQQAPPPPPPPPAPPPQPEK